MKKLCLALAVMMLSICVLTAVAYANPYYIVSSNGKGVNVRSNPWKADDNVLANLAYGTAVNLEYIYNNEWAVITLASGSDPAYVMRRFLSANYPGPYVPKKPTEPTKPSVSSDVYASFRFVDDHEATVMNSRSGAVAKLRWAPAKSAAVMGVLHAGDTVNVLAIGKDWYQVQDPETGMVGFLNAAFVKD